MAENKTDVFINGVYKHFKGGVYTVIMAGTDVDTLKGKVVYQSHETGKVWIRDYEEFIGFKEQDGELVERFEYIGQISLDTFLPKDGE